ncbi:FMO [Mytilus coruscus]|uniref:Flavin-containing monooxygenase n=1 Tax=Mytilus coruscus TaxID=42192 RepID=A0A6J8DLV1_MYTCO|nr:FMO [Mytilus coruscus]
MTDIKNKELAMKLKYVQTQRHTIQVDFIDYMDELATLNGCLPDLRCIQPIAALMPISELQCRLVTRVFQGKVKLPCYEEMMTDIKNKELAMKLKYVQTQRHTIQVDYIDYMDELATLNGCLPDLKSLLWSDYMLALNWYFGPFTPYQYRLNGPGKWSGARQAIMTQWDRTFASLKTRPWGFTEPASKKKFLIFYFVFAVAFCFFIQYIFFR